MNSYLRFSSKLMFSPYLFDRRFKSSKKPYNSPFWSLRLFSIPFLFENNSQNDFIPFLVDFWDLSDPQNNSLNFFSLILPRIFLFVKFDIRVKIDISSRKSITTKILSHENFLLNDQNLSIFFFDLMKKKARILKVDSACKRYLIS